MPNKNLLTQNASLLAATGLSAKTVSTVNAYIHGSVFVVEIVASDGTTAFIKHQHGQVEVGGTNEWGTGTRNL